ncbi:fatty acid desaturase family protein [Leeia aquatica]|uniref:Fatty acid desaturase family protein n=1 Tax=Leeia aquatica TaxID=2725557 RepID=A0A847S875_9NEIS|nr:fatty acid desaturase family protein [Leeia aquatica]NLR75963.1 fatty acid desaturase family protein [Leeia aquatica]
MTYLKHEFSPELRAAVMPLQQSSNWRGLLGVLTDYSLVVAAVLLSLWSPWCYPFSVLLIGSRQRALGALLHDAVHYSLARNRRWNRFLGAWPAGFAIFIDFDYYREIHVPQHHAFLGDPKRDPDRQEYVDTGLLQVKDRLDFLLRFVLKQGLLLGVPEYVKYLVTARIYTMLMTPRLCVGLLVTQGLLFAGMWWLAGPWGYLLFWVLPFITISQLLGWFNLLSEHYRLFERGQTVLEVTRNRFPSWWEHLFYGLHGENYHLTHHLFAGVPYWNLGKVHRILLADPAYRAANQHRGGMFSAPAGRTSVLAELLEDIRLYPSTHPLSAEGHRP